MNLANLSIDEFAIIAMHLSFVDRIIFFQVLWDNKLIDCTNIIHAFESFNILTNE